MNRDAVDAALGYAGNMPLTEDDKKYKNLVYVFCKNLYLTVLFQSLCEIDWRCARKEGILRETKRRHLATGGRYYYEMPADCVKPLWVDGNETDFTNDTRFIITEREVSTLYYVFHNRSADCQTISAPADQLERENGFYIERPENEYDVGDPRLVAVRPYFEPNSNEAKGPLVDKYGIPVNDDDFPEWGYTPYDTDVWAYFSYKLAAALVPKLRADDGAAARAQALEGLAAQLGEHVIARSRSGAANRTRKHKSWAEKCGLNHTLGAAAATGSPWVRGQHGI